MVQRRSSDDSNIVPATGARLPISHSLLTFAQIKVRVVTLMGNGMGGENQKTDSARFFVRTISPTVNQCTRDPSKSSVEKIDS